MCDYGIAIIMATDQVVPELNEVSMLLNTLCFNNVVIAYTF